MEDTTSGQPVNRRRFLHRAAAAAGTVALAGQTRAVRAAESGPDDLRIGVIGTGTQGQELLNTCTKISGVRVKAICDVWEAYNLSRASRLLTRFRHQHDTYTSYEDLLKRARDLDAILIATPDGCHAEQTVACLQAGLHVYCESPMAATLDDARKMARTAKETGKLLQIGLQRRSNPHYRFCHDHLINETKLLGRIAAINGQWNRAVRPDRGWPRKATLDDATLKRFGYASMAQFRNWRNHDGFCAGPLAELGIHQIDVFSWFLGVLPRAGYASVGTDYYDPKTHALHDTAMAILEYPSKSGSVRALYQTINANRSGGHLESVMGDEGTLKISEASGRVGVYREESAPDWGKWVEVGYLAAPAREEKEPSDGLLDVEETTAPAEYGVSVKFNDPPHQPHLENFFKAVRGEEELNCPATTALGATTVVLRLLEAAKTGRRVAFAPTDFEV